MYSLETTKQVDKFLDKLNVSLARRCVNGFRELCKDPYMKRPKCDIRKLSGSVDGYRLRVGPYRFNYFVDEDRIVVTVVEGFKRGRGYR